MKFFKVKTWLLLLGLIAISITLSSCNDRDVAQLMGETPPVHLGMQIPPQDSAGTTDCGCSDPAPPIPTSMEITSVAIPPKGKNRCFRVKVSAIGDCDMSACDPANAACICKSRRYYLTFNQNYQISDFKSIQIKKLDGVSAQGYLPTTSNDGIWVKEPFIATFEWTDANNNNPLPTAAQLSDGGICIIGVLTDPHVIEDPYPVGDDENE